MRETNGLRTTLTLTPVNSLGSTLSVELELRMSLPMPDHDQHLPDQIEASVHHAGLEVQRRLFRALIEKADQELVLSRRHGKAGGGLQRRGTRPYTFKTILGEVTVQRARVRHNHDGSMEAPPARARGTPHQLAVTSNLRDAVCDQMADQSAGQSRRDVCESAGDEDLLGRSTILEIVHREGGRLIAARRQRARSILGGGPEAQLAWLGPPLAEVVTDELSDVPPCDESDEDRAEWERVQAEWAATGFPGCEPTSPVAVPRDQPREVDPGYVIVEPDEVKTKAQPGPDRKEVWTFTAVVPVAGWRYVLAEATAEGLWLQVGALLPELGVLSASVGCWSWAAGRPGSGVGSRHWGSRPRR